MGVTFGWRESDMEVAGVGDITVESTDDDMEVEAMVSTWNLSMSKFSNYAGSKSMVKGAVAWPSGSSMLEITGSPLSSSTYGTWIHLALETIGKVGVTCLAFWAILMDSFCK